MASIVDITPLQPTATPSFRRIRAASRGFEWLFAALFSLFVALAVFSLWVLWFYPGDVITVGPHGGLISTHPPPDVPRFRDWPLAEKLAYTPVVLVRAAPTIVLFAALRGLFRRYANGEVFSAANARLIQLMGAALVADAVAPFLCHVALSATGYEIDRMWAHMVSVQEAVLGAVVFVIAQVMQAGHEIEQDREGFV